MEIDLTPDQIEQLEPLFAGVSAACEMGLPGILVAQVIKENDPDGRRFMRVGFLRHHQALQVVHAATQQLPETVGEPHAGS